MIRNKVVTYYGETWKIREAVSQDEADHAIAMAVARGTVCSQTVERRNGVQTILADVVRLNDDGTERQPT